jgi:PhoH-like ATPase
MVERKLRPAPSSVHLLPPARPPAPAFISVKLFVLDTNVLMHDPTSVFHFEEHDVYLPMLTLEELDANKKGMTEVARNARQASRFLDDLVTAQALRGTITEGIPLAEKSGGAATGRLFLQTEAITMPLPRRSRAARPTTTSSRSSCSCARASARSVILVSKDINMRIKALRWVCRRGLLQRQGAGGHGSPLLGLRELPADFWDRHGKGIESWQQGGQRTID